MGEGEGLRYPTRRKREKRTEVRARILSVAYALFSERGYDGASLERVAEAAGFSKGAVYSNFANKDELFYELVAARIDERMQALRAGEGGGPPVTAVAGGDMARRVGQALRSMGEADPGWQVLFIEFWLRCARNESLREKLAQRRLLMRESIAALIREWTAASGLKLDNAKSMDLATTVLALSNGLGIEGIIDPEAVSPELLGEILAKLVTPRCPGASADTRTS